MDGGVRDAEQRSCLARRQPDRAGEVALADGLSRAAEGLALGRTTREPRSYALDDPRPLELRERRQDMQLKLPSRRGGSRCPRPS